MKSSALLLANLALSLVSSEREADRVSLVQVSSDTEPGTIVKTFPHDLPGLNLLPSAHSDNFYLLQSGELMLARPLDCLDATNLSLALTHHILNQTVLHLLSVRVVEAEQLLQFSRAESVMSVVENQPAGTKVGQLSLTGRHDSKLRLTVHPANYRSKFLVVPSYNNNTADLTILTNKPLDREQERRIRLRLAAFNPVSQESAWTKVEIFVKNENDNSPVFTNKIYSLTAPLRSPRYSLMGIVKAEDADGDKLVYSLVRRNGPFIIVPQTGEILLTEEPQLKMYLLQVEAKDLGVPPRVSKPALVYISFQEEESHPNNVNSSEAAHSRVKRRVTRAVRPTKRTEFTEADGEPEGKIVFQLEKESEHETFKIRDENPWVTVEPNGAVRVKKKWDYEELGREKTIDFWVIITNSGSGGQSVIL